MEPPLIHLEESVLDQDDSASTNASLLGLLVGSPGEVSRVGHYGPEDSKTIRLEDCQIIIEPSERKAGQLNSWIPFSDGFPS